MDRRTITIGIVILVFVVLGFFVMKRRSKETYTLPDFSVGSDTSNICPDGYMLVCVSSNLHGVSSTIPFPASLANPCPDPSFPSLPLCLPQQRHMRPPALEYRRPPPK